MAWVKSGVNLFGCLKASAVTCTSYPLQGVEAVLRQFRAISYTFIKPQAPSATFAVTPVQKHSISLCHKRKCMLKLQLYEFAPGQTPIRRAAMAAGGQ